MSVVSRVLLFLLCLLPLTLLAQRPAAPKAPAASRAGAAKAPAPGPAAPPPGTRISSMPDERREQVLGRADWKVIDGLTEFATDRGHSLLELAIAWLAAQPTIASVIAGATKPEQVRANAVAAQWTLDAGDLAEVRIILEG